MAGENIGNAYVTVKPKVDDSFGKEVEKAGQPAGSGFGTKFSGAAKVAIGAGAVALGNILSSALSTAGQAIGQAFADMFQGAMDYEQLAGGVEKIFDQADISAILADANNAYKDLNMSANEYLASINQTGAAFAQTMGDQKGYDTARTGMKAIADYASGTGRNLDELNEKYALITRSTSSYQSIADQFSGILPATSKDFLEQAQAAGYLSDSYKSLTDVPIAEYQEAVTMMLEKGVTDMGLYGNTAMESAETMSGSLAMLKSAWSNVLAGMLDESADLDALFSNLFESIGAVVNNFAPRIGLLFVRLFAQLPQALYDAIMALPDTLLPALQVVFGEQMGQQVSDSLRGITEVFSVAWTTISQLVMNAMTVIGSIMEAVWPVVQDLVMGAMETISGVINDNWPAIQAIITNVNMAIQSFLQQVWPAISSLISSVMAAIDAVITTAWPIIQTIVSTVMSAVLSYIQYVWPAIQTIITTVVSHITSIINGLSAIVSTVTNIFNRVKSAITEPIEAAKNTIKNIVDKILSIFNNMQITIPKPRIPQITVDGGEAPWGIGGAGRTPSFNVTWAATGGFVDGATLIGAGEAGAEMILPKSGSLMTDFSEAVASADDDEELIRWLSRNLGAIIRDNAPTISRRDFDRMARGAIA